MNKVGKLLLGVFTAVVIVGIIVGLSIVGGPEQARMDERDQRLLRDLNYVVGYLQTHYQAMVTMPDTLSEEVLCDECIMSYNKGKLDRRLAENTFTYQRMGDQNASVCAPFEGDPDRLQAILPISDYDTFNYETGCMAIRK